MRWKEDPKGPVGEAYVEKHRTRHHKFIINKDSVILTFTATNIINTNALLLHASAAKGQLPSPCLSTFSLDGRKKQLRNNLTIKNWIISYFLFHRLE